MDRRSRFPGTGTAVVARLVAVAVSARQEILACVRRALEAAPDAPPVPRTYRSAPPDGTDVVALFAERVADYGAEVERVTDVDSAIHAALRGRSAVVDGDLAFGVPGAVHDTGQSPAELDRIAAVVTTAALGIALTGTIVLDHGSGQGRRALSLVPDLHVCVLFAEQIVYDVADALPRLDPRLPQTWISGPSATSDIELTRVEGVHGPRDLRVVIVDGPSA